MVNKKEGKQRRKHEAPQERAFEKRLSKRRKRSAPKRRPSVKEEWNGDELMVWIQLAFCAHSELTVMIAGSEPPDETSTQSSKGKNSPAAQEHQESPLPSAPTVSKRGGRRPGAGRGRGGHASHTHTSSEKEGKANNSPKDGHEPIVSGGETLVIVQNGNPPPVKRGRWRKEEPVNHDSDKDRSDGNNNNSDGRGDNSGIPTPAGTESNGNGATHHSSKAEGKEPSTRRDKDPSMNELKRRAIAMLEFLRSVQADMPEVASLVADSPPATTNIILESSGANPLGLEAEKLKGKLEKWQVEFA
jgi:hypothetical protein